MVKGFICSAFDLCHAGHMITFRKIKEQCDYLIVGLQGDPSLDNNINMNYRGKMKNKPIMSVAERTEILRGIKYIDEIVHYNTEAELYELLRKTDFDIRFQGKDWEGKKFTGHDLPHKCIFIERDHGYSTTELRKRVYEAERERLEEESRTVTVSPMQKIMDKIESIKESLDPSSTGLKAA